MPPTAKEKEISAARPDTAQGPEPNSTLPGDTAVKQQPVALEVPVTVNGARTVEGSDKREPFSETTKTVLIFGNGTVIRLSSSVAPGQLVFLTNEKTKREVVCQVVKSKNYRNVSGYVELEFTESVVGFWGMRFPGDRISSAPQPGGACAGQFIFGQRLSRDPAPGCAQCCTACGERYSQRRSCDAGCSRFSRKRASAKILRSKVCNSHRPGRPDSPSASCIRNSDCACCAGVRHSGIHRELRTGKSCPARVYPF